MTQRATRSTKVPQRVAAALAATAVVALYAAPASAASDNGVEVVNTETIQVYTDATGKVDAKRVYEQLAMTGHGSVDLANPIETDGLRNLDAFGGFEVKGGNQITRMSVDGEKHLRSVSTFDGKLPLEVKVTYLLDGKQVDPGDIVGKDGRLEVLYSVRNVTAAPQEVTFPDGTGGTITKTVEVPIPIVGSLTTLAPENFTNVQSKQANMAGDGRGATKLSFTMTLFPPLGSDTAEFGYTADITDGVVPRADISALPVNPLESPTFASAGKSYQGGADTGTRLAEGATTIDANLLKLRDGASELLAGLIKLHNGSTQLSTGLTDEAAPGAHALADGTGKARAGSEKLAAGAGRLDDGLGQLDGGVGDLSSGADRLAAGQRKLAEGLKELYDGVDSLPASVRKDLAGNAQYLALLGALQAMADGVGNVDDAPTIQTLLGGINAVEAGMRYPGGFGATDCILALGGGTPTKCGAMDGVQLVGNLLAQGATDLNQLKPVLGLINSTSGAGGGACPGGGGQVFPPPPATGPTNACEAVSTVYYALFSPSPTAPGAQGKVNAAAVALQGIQQKVGAQLLADGAGLDRLRAGLSNGDPANCLAAKQTATTSDDCGIRQGALFLKLYGIPMLVDGLTESIRAQLLAGIGRPTKGCDPEATLRCAAAALADGGGQLTDGVDKLVAGVTKLSEGGDLLAGGAGDLSDGLGKIDDGAKRLADGLDEAADGSRQITDGLGQASGGAPKLVDGAQRLSDEGTKKLIEAGVDTAQNYGEMYATLTAGAERAQTEKMAYGAPEGAFGLTAYSYVIKGENGEGGRNLARGLAGLGLLGAGAGAFALRRRFI